MSKHMIVKSYEGRGAIVYDSVTESDAEHAKGNVLVGGSFAGIPAIEFAAQHGPRGIVAHDCAVGRDGAGLTGIWYLEGMRIPAVAVDSMSARIADGMDTWERGIVSVTNRWARTLGVKNGDTVQAAVDAMLVWDGSPLPDGVEAQREVLHTGTDGQIVAVNTVRTVTSTDSGNVVCMGSHGGLTAGRYIIEIRPRGMISSDGGVGRDSSGTEGLELLDQEGVPGATVSVATARIGDGRSTYEDGIISFANSAAVAIGVSIGQAAAEAAQRMLLR